LQVIRCVYVSYLNTFYVNYTRQNNYAALKTLYYKLMYAVIKAICDIILHKKLLLICSVQVHLNTR